MVGLEVIECFNDYNVKIKYLIEIVFWINEEGVRFVFVMIGLGVFVGIFLLDYVYSCIDKEGKILGEELVKIGY